MPVVERLMELGEWDLTLIDEAPPSIVDVFGAQDQNMFGHVIITPIYVQGVLNDALILPQARYAGPVRTVTNAGRRLSGPGMAAWLGDEEGKGPIYESLISHEDASLTTWLNSLLPGTMPIVLGDISDPGTDTLTWDVIYQTPRDALSTIMRYFGTEFRINPDATIDVGLEADLFVTTPDVIVTRKPGGAEPLLRGIDTKRMEVEIDAENYASRVVELASGFGFDIATGAADQATVPYKDFYGNPVQVTKLIDAYQFLGELVVQHMADQEIQKVGMEQRVSLDADVYAISQHVQVGDSIWVYDPLEGILDLDNQVRYRGEVIYPLRQRVYGYTWPIERGMGVYLRRWVGDDVTYIDLTQWVDWEESVTGVESEKRDPISKPTLEELYPELF